MTHIGQFLVDSGLIFFILFKIKVVKVDVQGVIHFITMEKSNSIIFHKKLNDFKLRKDAKCKH